MAEPDDEYPAVERALLDRWPETKLEPSLERIAALVDLLGQPQHTYPVVHVTGTNGKTSTARMIEALLRGFGLRTGLFTSPHLRDVRERIAFDGEPIHPERFTATYREIEPLLAMVDEQFPAAPLSFFETLTGLAYAAFADAPVDVAVVEVGMGGRWDATNVADGQVAVLGTVAVDHANYLGDTVEAIAAEKGGIVKPGASLVLARQPAEVSDVLLRRAAETEATLVREGLEFEVRARSPAVGGQLLTLRGLGGTYPDVFVPLFGAHQAHNAACALAAVEVFLGGDRGRLDADIVASGFAAASSPGRLEIVRRSPMVALDAAHNPAAARSLAEAVGEAFTTTRLVGVVGVMADKDARGMLEALEPVLAEVVITAAPTDRGMDVDELAAAAVEVFGADRVEVSPRLDEAMDTATEIAESDLAPGLDIASVGVLVTGSALLVGAARTLLGAPR